MRVLYIALAWLGLTWDLPLLNATTIAPIICEGDTIGGKTIAFNQSGRGTASIAVGAGGHVVIQAWLKDDPADEGEGEEVVLRIAPGSPPEVVIRHGDPVRGDFGEGTFRGGGTIDVSASGEIAIRSGVDLSDGTSRQVLLKGQPGVLTTIAYTGQTLPFPEYKTDRSEEPLTLIRIEDMQMTNDGRVLFLGVVSPSFATQHRIVWVDAITKENERLVQTRGSANQFQANDALQVVVAGGVQGDDGSDIGGVRLYQNGQSHDLLVNGEPVPGIPGATYVGFNRIASNPISALSESGWVSFGQSVTLDGDQVGASFLGRQGSATELIGYRGMEAPGTGGAKFTGIGHLLTSASGEGLVLGDLESTASSSGGLWHWAGGELTPYLLNGTPVEGFLERQWRVGTTVVTESGRVFLVGDLGSSPRFNGVWTASNFAETPQLAFGTGEEVLRQDGTVAKTGGTANLWPVPNSERVVAEVRLGGFTVVDPRCLLLVNPNINDEGATLLGKVLEDVDENELISAADKGVKEFMVELFHANDAGEAVGDSIDSVVTDTSGTYRFEGLPTGRYVVKTNRLGDHLDVITFEGRRFIGSITTEAIGNEIKEGLHFLVSFPEGVVSGTVYLDTNANGQADDGESGIEGITVSLLASDRADEPLATVQTTAEGAYAFPDLTFGNYAIRVAPPEDQYSVIGDTTSTIVLNEEQPAAQVAFYLFEPNQVDIQFRMQQLDLSGVANLDTEWTTEPPVIMPVTNPVLLSKQREIKQGLVADGVTPLLFELSVPEEQLQGDPSITDIALEIEEGGTLVGGIAVGNLAVLEDGVWKRGKSRLRFDDEQTVHRVMVWPIAADALTIESPDGEVVMRLVLRDARTQSEVARHRFKLRKPPVMFVHGYNTPGFWGEAMFTEMLKTRPLDFLITIRYGQDARVPSGLEMLLPNTRFPFRDLVGELDLEIDKAMERIQANWALNRHDVVAHSQGGILVRMLCSARPPGQHLSHGFRDFTNFNRGRFRRVITIGSPHNGSRLVFYLIELQRQDTANWIWGSYSSGIASGAISSGILRDKFDPFGTQLAELHSNPGPWVVDLRAQFHFIQTTVNQGLPPTSDSASYGHAWLGLKGPNGSLVLPFGSDGVVDFDSMVVNGAAKNHSRLSRTEEIAHSGPAKAFSRDKDNPDTVGQVESDKVAEHVRRALDQDGSAAVFARYPTPTFLSNREVRDPIREAARNQLIVVDGTEGSIAQEANQDEEEGDEADTYRLSMTPVEGHPIGVGGVSWSAELFGLGGVASCDVVRDPNAPTKATLSMPKGFVGDLLVYAHYLSDANVPVFLRPELMDSRDPQDLEVADVQLYPQNIDFQMDEPIYASFQVTYADGTVMTRYPRAEMVQSSDESVIDTSNGRVWRVRGTGEVTITGQFAGESVSTEIRTVESLQIPESPTVVTDITPRRMTYAGTDQPVLEFEGGPERTVLQSSPDLVNWSDLYDSARNPEFEDPLVLRSLSIDDRTRLTIQDPEALANGRSSYYRLARSPQAAPSTGTTTLTFDLDGFGNFDNIDQGYGDRVSAIKMDAFNYDGSGGFTPNVVVSYGPDGADPAIWTTGYGDLESILFEDRDHFGQLEITFTADDGFLVNLQRWDMAAFTSAFGDAPTINEVSVRDGEGNVLFSETNVPIAIEGHTQYDFVDAPLEASVLILKFDSANLGNLSDDIAFDNIVIGQRPSP